MIEKQKKNNSFLMQGMILAAAGIITRIIGIAYRIPVTNILGDRRAGILCHCVFYLQHCTASDFLQSSVSSFKADFCKSV